MAIFVLYCTVVLALPFLVGFPCLRLVEKVFRLPDSDASGVWKFVAYASLALLLPLVGPFVAIYVFRKRFGGAQGVSWGRTLAIFFTYAFLSVAAITPAVRGLRLVVSPFQMV